MDVSGTIVWQGLVRMSFDDLSGLALVWAAKCNFFAIAEHEADERVETTHCHMMLGQPTVKKNTFQKIMKEECNIRPGKGNHWINEEVTDGRYKGTKYSKHALLVYLLKGKASRLKWSINISPAEVEAAASEWVEPDIGNSTVPVNSDEPKKKKKQPETHYQTCRYILNKAKEEHPDWFQCDITNYFAPDEDDFTLRSDKHKYMWDLMIKELNKREIRCSINELERFYTTIMRNDFETKSLLFQNFWRKIRV